MSILKSEETKQPQTLPPVQENLKNLGQTNLPNFEVIFIVLL